MDSVKSFMDRLKRDEVYRKKVAKCKDSEDWKQVITKEGFEFSPAEFANLWSEMRDSNVLTAEQGWTEKIIEEVEEVGNALIQIWRV